MDECIILVELGTSDHLAMVLPVTVSIIAYSGLPSYLSCRLLPVVV